jgi:hypothetical protein
MTNTTQTDFLDGVEPDCWRYSSANGIYRYRGPCANFDKDYKALKPVALYSRETVEALLEAQRAEYEARIEAHRKQVLLEAAERCVKLTQAAYEFERPNGFTCARELRRMAEEGAE